jgi:polyisoprenoid-binding protein YceI
MSRKTRTVEVDASSAECLVFTQKEGLLSKVAHDLKIRVTEFSLAWDGTTLTARFDPCSLRVVNAMVKGRENPTALSDSDKKKIEKSIVADVLHARKHRSIGFKSSEVVSEGKGYRIKGELTLHGVTRPISAKVNPRGDRWSTQLSINQPDYGIEPFSAMLGTLKVKPKVRIHLSVSDGTLPLPGS